MQGSVASTTQPAASRTYRAPHAGECLPVSRLRPDRALVELAGVGFCRERSLVPMWRAQGGILVATARPRDRAALDELRQKLMQPVVPSLATRGEIRIAIENSTGAASPQLWRAGLADVLVGMRLLRADQAGVYALAAEDERYLGAALVEALLITEEERREAVGLAFNLPSADPGALSVQPNLEALFEPNQLRGLRVLPLWSVGSELFMACDSPPQLSAVEQLQAASGLAFRFVLVPPVELDRRLDLLSVEVTVSAGEIGDVVRKARLATPAQIEIAARASRQTREPFTKALQRLAGFSDAQLAQALAQEAGFGTFTKASTAEADAAASVPAVLAQRLRAVPLRRDGRSVSVAMANPWDRRARNGLGALLDADVHAVITEDADLDALIASLDANAAPRVLAAGTPERTARLLAQAIATRDAPELAELDGGAAGTVTRLWEAVPAERHTELLSVDLGVPLLSRLLMHPSPSAVGAQLPDDAALLPVLDEDDVLTMAVASAADADRARDFALRGGRALRLAVASEADLAQARSALDSLDLSALSTRDVRLAAFLERRRGLARDQVLALFRRLQTSGEPFDVAASAAGVLSADEARDALAAFLALPAIVLRRSERIASVPDATGRVVARRILDDVVDPAVATLLTTAECARWGSLPIRRDEGRLVVAVADPLDDAGQSELRARLGEPLSLAVASRNDIREASSRSHGRPMLGDRLLNAGAITPEQLRYALDRAERSGVRLGEALVSQGVLSEEQLIGEVARQQGMPFCALRGIAIDAEAVAMLPEEFARDHRILPISVGSDGAVTIAVQDPGDTGAMEQAREIIGRETSFIATTLADIDDALERAYHEDYLQHSAGDLLQRSPDDSAHKVLSRGQKVFFIGLILAIGLSIARWPIPTLTAVMAITTGFYLMFSLYKFFLIYRALAHTLEVPMTTEVIGSLADRDLPVYTLLIPLYREAAVLPGLVRSLSRLDYPPEKLDVKLILEEDDVETIAVARLADLPAHFHLMIVPNGLPKGKPKACNYGLIHARGEYVVIFDAEDRPEPDQLKKALTAFLALPQNVVCVQAKLNYYNRDQNALTRWFTTEYSTWFDLFLPGLDASNAPIPLGGTSNHFRMKALRAVGGWDPFNVTEDADLGLRIFKLGGRTAVIDSTTFEEANSVLDNWIRQRSRWVKGYIQTYLVHMRHPLRLASSLGIKGFISFQLVIGGTIFSLLLNPVLWAMTGGWYVTHWDVMQKIFPAWVYYMGAVSLYGGNFAFAYMNVAGCLRRRYYSLVKWALLSPVYWVLMSIGAWKGFLQLFYRPFYWEKTIHGLTTVNAEEAISLSIGDEGEVAGAL